jgi:pimeloyl-ACP methyl ester carboxylesterase
MTGRIEFHHPYIKCLVHLDPMKLGGKTIFSSLVCLSITLLVCLISSTYPGSASPENKTSMQPIGIQGMTSTNDTNIVLVHGIWSDGSVWSKVIPVLLDAGHRVIAAQLPLRSLGDDVDTVRRAVEELGKPTILVGHSYGGEVITNAGYNNPNVTGLVYIAALAPDEGETGTTLFEIIPRYQELLQNFTRNVETDSAGLSYLNPDKYPGLVAHDVPTNEANVLAVAQKPTNESIAGEKSGPPAWRQIPSWYQISENDRLIPPEIQRTYADRMNASILSINSSHSSLLSHPDEIAELILNATKGGNK